MTSPAFPPSLPSPCGPCPVLKFLLPAWALLSGRWWRVQEQWTGAAPHSVTAPSVPRPGSAQSQPSLHSFPCGASTFYPGGLLLVWCWPFKGLGQPEQQEIQTASLGSLGAHTVISALKTRQGKAGGGAPPSPLLPPAWPVRTHSKAAGPGPLPPSRAPHSSSSSLLPTAPGQGSEPKLVETGCSFWTS